MLERLMLTLVHTGTDQYRQQLFQAMFALAFYAFLRIGEITITGKDRHNAHLIQKNQIRMQTKQIELKFISYKHSQGQPFSLSVMEAQGQAGPMPWPGNASLFTSSGRQAWPTIPVCHRPCHPEK